VLALLSSLRLTVYVRQMGQDLHNPASSLSLLSGLDEFRQHLGGELCIILLRAIGAPVEVCQMDQRILVEAVALLRGYQALQRQRYAGAPWIHTPRPVDEPSYT
jgi:3-dehydroquinate synthase